MIASAAMLPPMPNKVLFSVKDSDRFPAAVWIAFRETCTARGESWLDVLRRLCEQYTEHPSSNKGPQP